jgi:hypothetical protein
MRRLKLLAAALSLTLIGCSKDIIATSAGVCRAIEPIRPSRKDVLTQGTKEQIAGTNAVILSSCGKGPEAQRVSS